MDAKFTELVSDNFTIDFTLSTSPHEVERDCLTAYPPRLNAKVGYIVVRGNRFEQEFEVAFPVLIHTQKSFRGQANVLRKILARRHLTMVDYRVVANSMTAPLEYQQQRYARNLEELRIRGIRAVHFNVDFSKDDASPAAALSDINDLIEATLDGRSRPFSIGDSVMTDAQREEAAAKMAADRDRRRDALLSSFDAPPQAESSQAANDNTHSPANWLQALQQRIRNWFY